MGDLSNEPSMEDILASIKKIIAEDSDRKLSPPVSRREIAREDAPEMPKAQALPVADVDIEEDADVFELSADAIHQEAEKPAADAKVVPEEIVSTAAAAASRSALTTLSRLTVKPDVAGSDTLEGLVREMLRPMLKEWLDANLPQLVEVMVAKEIDRITGKTLI